MTRKEKTVLTGDKLNSNNNNNGTVSKITEQKKSDVELLRESFQSQIDKLSNDLKEERNKTADLVKLVQENNVDDSPVLIDTARVRKIDGEFVVDSVYIKDVVERNLQGVFVSTQIREYSFGKNSGKEPMELSYKDLINQSEVEELVIVGAIGKSDEPDYKVIMKDGEGAEVSFGFKVINI